MPYGFQRKILRVDLSTGRTWIEEPDEKFYRMYVGGAALIGYYLLREVPAGADPYGPENVLIVSASILTGVPVSGGGRHSVGGKSPMSGGMGKGESGGFFGAELKNAGWDAIVVQGVAPKPTYLAIADDKVQLRDASHLWGKEVYDTEEAIRAEWGDHRVRISAIGPGGERLVRYACVMNDRRSAVGRTGMGAVMGSKRLKAIAVRGTQRVQVARPDAVKAQAHSIRESIARWSQDLSMWGTGAAIPQYNEMGNLPVRNWRDGRMDGVENISAETLKQTVGTRMDTCYACAVRCKKVVQIGPPWNVRPEYGGPEYETLAGFGTDCGVTNLAAICLANQICNANSLDTISASGTIAFAMECFENGLLTTADTDGIELRFGNEQAMLQVLERIVRREGIGDVLAEGSRKAAQRIGRGADKLAMQVKGVEFGKHDPRLKPALGIGFALSFVGGDHVLGVHDTGYVKPGRQLDILHAFGFHDTMPLNEISANKARVFYYGYQFTMAKDCLGLCHFLPWTAQELAELVSNVTGWDTSWYEIAKVAERAFCMGRAFNAREGFSTQDDLLPERFFQPTTSGAHRDGGLNRQKWLAARTAAYGIFNWDPETGAPTRGKLDELGLGWVDTQPPSIDDKGGTETG